MADSDSEFRIEQLEARVALMPGSRVFVALADEYRRARRFDDALSTLQGGLEAHPGYLSAHVALARVYQEMGRAPESIEAFTKVLAMDRENMVAAKSLAEIYDSQGDKVESIKKWKLYRALSRDPEAEESILRLEKELSAGGPAIEPPGVPPEASVEISQPAAAALPPEAFEPVRADADAGPEMFIPAPPDEEPFGSMTPEPVEEARADDLFAFAPEPAPAQPEYEPPSPPTTVAQDGPSVNVTAPFRISELGVYPPPTPAEPRRAQDFAADERTADQKIPPAKTLAELYFDQGHIAEAETMYRDLARANPSDGQIAERLSSIESRARAFPADSGSPLGSSASREQRIARLKRWLAAIQSSGTSA